METSFLSRVMGILEAFFRELRRHGHGARATGGAVRNGVGSELRYCDQAKPQTASSIDE